MVDTPRDRCNCGGSRGNHDIFCPVRTDELYELTDTLKRALPAVVLRQARQARAYRAWKARERKRKGGE